MKNLFCATILLFLGLEASAKEEFTVFISQGKNLALVYKNTKYLEMGMVLSARDTVSVVDSGYVALFHNPTGKVVEFKSKGLYGLQEANSTFNLVSEPPLVTFEDIKVIVPPTGSVPGVRYRDIRFLYFLLPRFNSGFVFREKVKFEWIYAFDPKTRFRLELKDEGTGAVVFDTTVFNTSEIVLDFKTIVPKMEQDEEERFELSIKSESDEWMDSNMIMLYDQDGAQKKLYEFINKARAFYGGNSAIENYVLGAIYERKNLFADAFQAYKKAHELAPHVKTFRDRHIEIGELPYNTK
jgi:hypothetical protein